MSDLAEIGVEGLLSEFGARRVSPVEVLDALYARIEAVDRLVGGFTALCLERAVQIQSSAATLGPRRPMDRQMAERLYPTKHREDLVRNYWQYLLRQVRRQGLDDGMPDERDEQEGR